MTRESGMARRLGRLRWSDDQGISLINVLIAFVLLSAMVGMALGVVTRNSSMTRNAEAQDAANLYANGVIERARAVPWSELGFPLDDGDGNPTVGLRTTDAEGRPTVVLERQPSYVRPLKPLEHGIQLDGIKGSRFDVRTDITWEKEPPASVVNPDSDTSMYGVKRITVEVTWGNNRKVTISGTRSPSVGEAIPTGIENDGGFSVGDPVADPVLEGFADTMSLVASVDRIWQHRFEMVRGDSDADEESLDWSDAETICTSRHGQVYTGNLTCGYTRVDEGGWFRVVVETTTGTKYSNLVYLNALSNFQAPQLSLAGSAWNFTDLTWTDPDRSPTSYFEGGVIRVQRSDSSTSGFVTISGDLPRGTREWRHDNPPGGTNWYRACGVMGAGTEQENSLCSNKISVYTIHAPTKPTLTLTYSASTGKATATWNAVTDAATYQVQSRVYNGSWSSWTTKTITAPTRTTTYDVENGTRLQVQVRAVNQRGTGPWSDVEEVEALLNAPTLSVGTVTNTSVAFSWTAVTGATRYEGQYRINGGSWSSVEDRGTARTRTVSRSTQGDRIEYRVRAVNGAGHSAWSNIAGALTTIAAPGVGSMTSWSSYPYLYARLNGVSCPAGTVIQSRGQVAFDGTSWPGFGPWADTGRSSQSLDYRGSTSYYDRDLDVSIRVRCVNKTSGAVGPESPSQIIYNIMHPVPTPTGTWLQVGGTGAYYRKAGWGASCPSLTSPRYRIDINAATFTYSRTNITYTSYSHEHEAWGYGTATVQAWCYADRGGRTSSRVSVSKNF